MEKKLITAKGIILTLTVILLLSKTVFGQITQVGGTQTAYVQSNDYITLNKPAGVSVGDIMIVNIVKFANRTDGPSAPAGWTVISSGLWNEYNRGAVAYRVVDGTEGASFTFHLTSAYTQWAEGALVAYTGVDLTNPFDVAPGSITGDRSSVVYPSGITTSTPNALVIMCGMGLVNGPLPTFTSWSVATSPTLTELYDANGSMNASVGAATGIQTIAGPTGIGTITTSTYCNIGGVIFALKQRPPTITLASSSQVSNGNIMQNTANNVIFRFSNTVTIADAIMSGLQITTSGTYSGTDLTNLKAWYSVDDTFSSAEDFLLSTKTESLGAGRHAFPGWTNQAITKGTTGYIFITADIPCSATIGATVAVSEVTPGDVTFEYGNIVGSTTAGGEQNIQMATPANVTGISVSAGNAQSELLWTNPVDCYDEIMIVARAGSAVAVSPSGDGTSYSASTIFGSGTRFGEGYVIYKGNGSPQTVTNLTNNATYYFTFFTRYGSGWSSGITASATPFASPSSGDYRSAVSGNWSGISTWETFNGSGWVAASAAPTNANGKITILNGHAVAVSTGVTVDQVVVATGGQIIVSPGITLIIANGPDVVDFIVNGTLDNTGTLTTTGSLAVNDGGRYKHSTSGLSLPAATWNTGSTCEVTGYISGSLTTGWSVPFYNFTWNCSGQGANVSFGNRAASVNGTFTLANTNGYSIRPAWNPTYGNYVQTGGIYNMTNDLTPRVVNVLNDFVVSGGTFNMSSSSRSGSLEVAGNFSIIENGTITETGSSNGTISFTGSTEQIYTSGGSLTETVDIQVNEGAILQMADQNTTVFSEGLFYLSTGATLGITSPDGITTDGTSLGNIQSVARVFEPGATYVYNGTVNQNTGSGLPSNPEGKLIINNNGLPGSNTVTLDAGRTIEAGGSVEIVNGIFNSGDNLTMATTSTITRSGGSMTGTPQGTGIYNVSYTGNSMTTTSEISGSGLNNITASLTSGQTLTLSQDIVPNGDLTLTSGILNLGEHTCDRSAVGGTLTVADNATLKIGGTNALPANYTYSLGATSMVEYSGEAQTITPGTYGNLTTNGTGTKTIIAGSAVTVTTELTTFDRLTIESTDVNSNGSLIVNGTSTGKVTYNRRMPGSAWHYVSSPVSLTAIPTGSFYAWSEVAGDWNASATPTPASGIGYTLETTGNMVSFTGSVVTSVSSISATSPYSDCDFTGGSAEYSVRSYASGRDATTNYGGGGWNLLGNPFACALNVNGTGGFIEGNSSSFDPNYIAVYIYNGTSYTFIGSQISGWEETTTGFGDNNIQVGQGFFILSHCNTSSFSFTSGMQTHDISVPMTKSAKAEANPWPGLQLKVKYGDNENSTLVVYNEKMSSGLDPGYDVGLLSANPDVEIYTSLVEKDNSVNFARQALPSADCDKNIVPVGIDSEKGGEVTFSANVETLGNNKFWLEDRAKGIFTDISTKSYTVTLPAKTYGIGRFFIIASTNTPTGIKPTQAEDMGVRVWISDGRLIIKGDISDKARCEVYDVNGGKFLEIRLTDSELNTVTLPEGSKGVYLVRVIDGVKVTTRKVAIL